MAGPLNLLIIEDSPDDAERMVRELRRGGFEVRWQRVQTEADFLARLENPPDLILSDYSLPQFTGVKAVELLRARGLDVPFILVSGAAGEEKAVEAMKCGATDYLLKDRIARLSSAVGQALETRGLRNKTRRMQEQLATQRAALRESEARFAGIINSAKDGIITVNHEQRIVLFNPAAEEMFGYRADQLLDQPLSRLIPQRFQGTHGGHVRKFGETGVTSRRMGALGTIFGLRANGTEFPIEASISQVETGGQKLFTVILRDITERKAGEEARNRLAAIVESSDDAILSETLEGRIVTWNAGAERVYGYAAAEVIGRPIRMLIPPELQDEELRILDVIKRGERVAHLETIRLRKNGSRINVSLNISPIRDAEGRIIGASKTARDVTERKRLEAAVAAAAEEERGRIARDLHDGLGQQLGGALFLSDLVHRDLKKREAVEHTRAGQVHALVVEALEQTRELARGLYPVPPEPEGLMTALQNLADRVARDRRMECAFDANSAVLLADQAVATHLYRIAQEAVNNALKHSGASRIEIGLARTASALEMCVRDFGRGLPKETTTHGLGMLTMRQRAQLIGARLTVQNAPGGGLAVRCSLQLTWTTPRTSETEVEDQKPV
jgi:PAS domain S-box-containing protein